MIDAEISFVSVEIARPAHGRRMAPLAGLGCAALASLSLWGLLALGVSQLL